MTTDGRGPSVASEEHPGTGPRPVPPEPDPDGDLVPDDSPVWMRRELRRLVRADQNEPADPADTVPGSVPPDSGRHARRDGDRNPRLDYVPRHAIRTPGPGAVSATELTERFARVRQDPTEPPMPSRPEPSTAAVGVVEPEPAPPVKPVPPGKRVRVVLAQRKGATPRPVRMVVDVQELTPVGEVLSSSLIRSQLALALRIGGIALIALGSLPVIFVIFPVLGRYELFGLRLPWLLLGVLAYPFLLSLGWMHSRSSERLEQVFVDHIQN